MSVSVTESTTRSALITGASRGIGSAIAMRLAEQGFGLTISARDHKRLALAAQRLREAGAPKVVVVASDSADRDTAERLVTAHRDEFSGLDALVLSAGVGSAGRISEYPMRRVDKTFEINFRAPFDTVQQALPLLRETAAASPALGTRIIALSSLTGVYAEPGLAVYGAIKAALISFVETLNAEESVNGVSATAIAPGYVATDMSDWVTDRIAAEDMIAAGDIAELAAALLAMSAKAVVSKIVVGRAGTLGYSA